VTQEIVVIYYSFIRVNYLKNNFCFILGNFDIAVKKVCNIAKYKAHRDHQHKKKILKTAKNIVF